jgi:hypothetical protein
VSEALAIKQRERAEREKRLSEEAVSLLAALTERDEVVAAKELAAAGAITKMAGDGLSVVEIAAWCDGLDAREVGRLAKLAAPSGKAPQTRVD